MRKFMVLPMAGLLALSIAAPVAAGPNVSNTSGGGTTIYGEWYGEGPDGNTYGYVSIGNEKNYGGFGEIYQETGQWVPCETSGGSPSKAAIVIADTTPGGENYGFVGTRTWGYTNDVQVVISRRLETGSASGTVDLYTETVNDCEGIYEGASESGVALTVSATGVGDLATFRGTGSYKIPSQFNGHSNYRGSERQATGSVAAGSIGADFDSANMSKFTWTEHVNS